MNWNLCRAIIGCLHVSGSVETHVGSLQKFPARDWEASLTWLDLSGIALAFWDRLQKLRAEDVVPAQSGAALAAKLADHRQRVAVMAQEFDSINRQFERAGIEYVVWKGFALIPEYCPDACLRPSYDYDYLVSRNDLDRAQDVLQAAGYVRKSYHGTQHHVTFKHRNLPSRLAVLPRGLYTAALPRRIELHVSLWDEEAARIPLRVPERPLDRKLRRTWQGLCFYSLGEDDEFVFQTVHVFRHILENWCRLGWLLDIAYFLEHRSTDLSFWKRLCSRLAVNKPLAGAGALAILLASRLFHAPLAAPVKNQILGAMRGHVSLWVDHYGLRSALNNFSKNKYALFLHREFARDEISWRQIRRRRLFPVHLPNSIAGAPTAANSVPLPGNWRQAWYVVKRLIYHWWGGAAYIWEFSRWQRIKARACPPRLSSA